MPATLRLLHRMAFPLLLCLFFLPASGRNLSVLSIGYESSQRDAVELGEMEGLCVQIEPCGGGFVNSNGHAVGQKSFYWEEHCRSEEAFIASILTKQHAHYDAILCSHLPLFEEYPEEIRNFIVQKVLQGTVLFLFGPSPEWQRHFAGAMEIPCPFQEKRLSEQDPFQTRLYSFGSGKILVQPNYTDHRRGFLAPLDRNQAIHRFWFERFAALLRTMCGEETPCPPVPQTTSPGAISFADGVFSGSPGTTGKLSIQWKNTRQENGSTQFTCSDIFGRVTAQWSAPGMPAEADFAFPQHSLSVYNTIHARHSSGEEAEGFFTIPENRSKPPFRFVSWNTVIDDDVRSRDYFRRLADQGIDTISNFSPKEKNFRILSSLGFEGISYANMFCNFNLEKLFSNEEMKKRTEDIRLSARIGKQYAALGHSLGDENYLSPFTEKGRFLDVPEVWSRFALWLKGHYASLDDWNRAWGTSFENWDRVHFSNEQEMFSYQTPAPWVDFRRFLADEFAKAHHTLFQAVTEEDPQAVCGWEGLEEFSPYDGIDYSAMGREMTMGNVYARSFYGKTLPNKLFNGWCLRSLMRESALKGLWVNGLGYPNELRQIPWFALFAGFQSIWWWHSTFPEHEVGALDGTLEPTPAFAAVSAAVRELKGSAVRLWLEATRTPPKIAIYFSSENFICSALSSSLGTHVNNLHSDIPNWSTVPAKKLQDDAANHTFREMWLAGASSPCGHCAVSFRNFMTMLQDLNLDADVVSREQIEHGALDSYKMLILPFAEALSDMEAQNIRSFVEKGGKLLADYRPGIRFPNGNLRTHGALDDCFGIRQNFPFRTEFRRQDGRLQITAGDALADLRLPLGFCQAELKTTTAAPNGNADDGTPLLMINKFGKGTAIFMNCDLGGYGELRCRETARASGDFFRKLLTRKLQFPFYDVIRSQNGTPLTGMHVFHRQSGCASYVGIVQENLSGDLPNEISIPLPQEGTVYDLRKHKKIGTGKTIRFPSFDGVAFLGIYPEELKDVACTLQPTSLVQGDTLELRFSADDAPRCVMIRVFSPDQQEVTCLRQNIAFSGTGKLTVPLALNDKPGTWSIACSDLVTGNITNHTFKVRRKK